MMFERKITEFQNANEVITFFNDLVTGKSRYVFRGYSKESETLPKLLRTNNKDFIKHEWDLLREFEVHGANYFHAIDAFDFIADAQHFGLPTRLLDFSFNPFVALAFALYLSKDSEKDDKYYYVAYCDIKKHFLMYSADRSEFVRGDAGQEYISMVTKIQDYVQTVERWYNEKWYNPRFWYEGTLSWKVGAEQEIEEKIEDSRLVFIVPKMANSRIIAQQGLFLLPTDLDGEKYDERFNKHLTVVKIHENLREDLLRYLDVVGCNMYYLMPDLANVCSTVIRRFRDGFVEF